MPYRWSETNPYKFNFLAPPEEDLEDFLETDIQRYAENQWDNIGYETIVFTLSMYNDITDERRFFACLCCPATVTAQGQHSFHLSEATDEDDAIQICDEMADSFSRSNDQPNELGIPASEIHLWN